MNFAASCLCLASLLTSGLTYPRTFWVMKQPEHFFCIDVQKSSSNTKLGLILQVNYPQSFAEAGEVIIGEEELSAGSHNISYKYVVTNMTHDMQVFFDGRPQNFLKSEVPRWYSVSTFREVLVVVQGDISVQCLVDVENVEDVKDLVKNSTSVKEEVSVFLTDTKRDKDETPKTKSEGEKFNDFHHNVIIALLNETRLIESAIGLELNKSDDIRHPVDNNIKPEELWQKVTSNSPPDNLKDKIPTTDNSFNQSELHYGHTQPILECVSGDCYSTSGQDYAIAIVLCGLLGVMIIAAIVISVVFHKKKKRLVAESKLPRQRRQDLTKRINSDDEESHIMLGEVNNTYEVIN